MQETFGIHRFNTLGFEYLQSTMKVCDVFNWQFSEVQNSNHMYFEASVGGDWGASKLASLATATLSNQTFFSTRPR